MNKKLHEKPMSAQQKPSVRFVEVSERNEGQRLDNFLLSILKGVPKSKIYRIIRKGEVRVNKGRAKPETKLFLGDSVRIPPVSTSDKANKQVHVSDNMVKLLQTSKLFEDEDILVINKPSGLAVHGGSGVNLGLIEALRETYPTNQFLELVHRLDRDTSGVILVAKSRKALKNLHAQFREDRVNKIYHLLSFGAWPKSRQKVDLPLRKNELKSGERMVSVSEDGKKSRTLFRLMGSSNGFSYIEAKPVTGRTHQIRVHVAFYKCPIVGDQKYLIDPPKNQFGLDKCRLMLHAKELEFELLSGEKKRVSAPYDDAFESALQTAGVLD